MSNPGGAGTVAPERPLTRPRSRRWLRVLVALLLVLLAVVAFAPAIIANTSLLNVFVRRALADVHGDVTVGGASLGWFSPIELRDVRITDPAGQPVIAIPRLATAKTLSALIRSQDDIGDVAIDQHNIEIATENGRTNIEAIFEKYLESDSSAPAPNRTAIHLKLTNGRILLRDRNRELTGVEAEVQVPALRAEAVTFTLKAASSAPTVGDLNVEVSVGGVSRVHLAASNFPLDVLDPFLKRLDPAYSLSGSLTSDLTMTWSDGFASFTIDGTAHAQPLEFAAPWLRGDRLTLASVELPITIDANGTTVKVQQATLTCDLGKASFAGEFPRGGAIETYLDRPGVSASVQIDLAKLAHALPRLTSLRAGTEIQTGSIALALESKTTPQGTAWTGNVKSSDLRATREGKLIEWLEPLSIEFTGRRSGGLPVLDTFIVRSDFLAGQARGTPDSFKAAANIYLDRLASRLGEFVDLGGITLDGQAVVRTEVTHASETGAISATASIDLTNFAFADSAGLQYREPKLGIRFEAAGVYHANEPVRLTSGTLGVTAAQDTLQIRLLEPIADAASLSSVRLAASLSGSLARWKARIAGIAPIPRDWQIEGQGTAAATLAFNHDRMTCESLTCGFDNFVFHGAGLDIREAKLSAEGTFVLLRKTGGMDCTGVKIVSSSLTAAVPKLALQPAANGDKSLVGSGTFSADLAALQRWFGLADPRGTGFAGRADGSFQINALNGATDFQANCDITNFILGLAAAPTWSEPNLSLALEGSLDIAHDELRLRSVHITRDGLALDANGTYSHFSTTQDVALTGTLGYDFAKLSPLVRGLVGGEFAATGSGSKPFHFTGSLVPKGAADVSLAEIAADAGLSWQSLQAYGFDIGPAELNVKLAHGVITANRIEAKFGGGDVRVTPTLTLAPMTLSLEKGPIVEKTSLTPKTCAGAIGYALPVVANALQADGQVSFTIAENTIPLADASKAYMKGQLQVHKATVGSGPIVAEVAKLLGASSTSMTLANEMSVPIRVENGRVYHENLRLTINGFSVTTNGSVGFDKTLALVADVPVPAQKLFKNNPRLMQALANKTVKVPIGGTLSKPVVDAKAFENAIAQLTKDATKSVAGDLIKSGLDKLLMPKK